MTKTKTNRVSCADFGLGAVLVVPIDGEAHEPLRCFVTPSAVIRANRLGGDLADFAVGYFAAKSQGLLDALGFEETGDPEDDVLRFFDLYAVAPESVVEGGGEPGPTE